MHAACERLAAAGVDRVLVVAGDDGEACGEFASTLDVLSTDLLPQHGIRRIGVAGHPEGHRAIGPTLLWRTLREKQTLARRRGLEMHVVTQFGFDPQAVASWDELPRRTRHHAAVRVGMAGPASLRQLIAYAMQCGVGASLRGAMQSMAAMRNVAGLATSPDQMLSEASPAMRAPRRRTSRARTSTRSAARSPPPVGCVRSPTVHFEMKPAADAFTLAA